MKYRIPVRESLSRTEKRYRIAKWGIFILMMILFYSLMRTGIFNRWLPMFLIPLSTAVAMHENEIPACVFSLFCGYMTDIACGYIFGFSAVWLMAVGVAASLLVKNLIRLNIVNFLIIDLVAVLTVFSMDYLFNIFIWNVEHGDVIVRVTMIPSAVATVIVSPAVYYPVSIIEKRLGSENAGIVYYGEPVAEEKGDEE